MAMKKVSIAESSDKERIAELEAENQRLRNSQDLAPNPVSAPVEVVLSSKEEQIMQRRIKEAQKIKKGLLNKHGLTESDLPVQNGLYGYKLNTGKFACHSFRGGPTRIPKLIRITSIDDPETMQTAGELRPKQLEVVYVGNYVNQKAPKAEEAWVKHTSSWSLQDWLRLVKEKGLALFEEGK